MRRPTTLGVSTVVLIVIGLLFSGTLVDTASAKGHKGVRTFRPAALADGQLIANSGRGQYAWLGQQAQPTGSPAPDIYYRDQVPWGAVEPTQGGPLDTSYFDDGIARANATRGTFSFRVMAYCPGCWDREAQGKGSWTPKWLPLQAGTDVPDWNSEGFLSAWESLMARLGAKYANDPRLGSVDVGGFGAYGEWHVEQGQQITVPNAMRVVRAVLNAFPRQHVVMNAMIPAYVNAALAMSPRIGLRTDCLGGYNMGSLIPTAAKGSLLAERWKTQPVYSEWCHSGVSTVQGAAQVRQYHVSTVSSGNLPEAFGAMSGAEQGGYLSAINGAGYRYAVASVAVPKKARAKKKATFAFTIRNSGSAPTYDAWRAVLQIRNAAGTVVATRDLGIDLTRALPGNTVFKRSFKPRLARGTYSLDLSVVDPSGYLAPMALAMPNRSASVSYRVGLLKIGR